MDDKKNVLSRRSRGHIYLFQLRLAFCHAAAILLVSLGDGIAEEVDTLKAGRTVRDAFFLEASMQWVV